MSRAKTAEEARKDFLNQVRMYVDYWADKNVHSLSTRERLNGLAFSILNILDGTSSAFPTIDVVLRPHPDDKAYHQAYESDWYEDGQVINADVMLHDAWYEKKTR